MSKRIPDGDEIPNEIGAGCGSITAAEPTGRIDPSWYPGI